MEALGPGGDRASPASSTRSLDLRRLSARADSAYSSFSAASGAPEPRTPSPGTDLLPYLDWDYVRVVWGGPASAAPAAGLRASPQPRPAAAARSGLRLPEVQGTSGPLSRQATPLLFALAAEAEAEARAVEPPSPPASRAAYRQRLQGAQRRVLRETSFQRKELRMSLPARLRPAAPARPPAAHPRSASLSHPGGEVEPGRSGAPARGPVGRGRLATQQRKWCFSEPGKLDRVGRGGGSVGGCSSDACSSSGFAGPEPQERRVLAELEDHQIRWLPETQPRGTEDPEPRSLKFGDAHRPSRRSRSASGEVLAPWGGSGGVTPVVQVAPQGAETPRLLFQTKLSRFLTQKEAAVLCPAECLQSSPADREQRVSETCLGSARLPSLPDDEVFLEDVPLVRMRSPPDTHAPTGNPTSVHVSDQQYETGLGQGVDQAGVPPEHPLHEHPETAGADDSWRRINGSVSITRTTCCSPPGTANGDIPTFNPTGLLTIDPLAATDPLKPLPVDVLEPPGNSTPGAPGRTALAWGTGQPVSRPTWHSLRLEELVQELARLDPSMSDTLTSCPSPEPPLGLLDGLIPLAEVWAAMRPAGEEAGKDAAGTPEPGSSQLPPTSQEMRSENHTTHPVPDQPCGQGLPDPNSIEAKKVSVEGLVETGWGNSPEYGLRIQSLASPLSTHALPADGASQSPPKDAAGPSGRTGAAAPGGPGLGQARGCSGGRGGPDLCPPRPRAVQQVHGRPRARAWPAAAAGHSPGPRAPRAGPGGRRRRPRRAGLSAAATRSPEPAAGRRQGAEGARGAARAGPAGGAGEGPARGGAARLSSLAGGQGRRSGPAAQPRRAGPAPSGPTGRRQERPWPSSPASQDDLAPRDPFSR
uniref:ASD1 domain-containing protein n=1 Tax=Felis catus TaxID=9685 RepID=A0ABI7XU31_FELCA